MKKSLEKALARPEILQKGPLIAPSTGDKLPFHISTRKIYSFPDSLAVIAREIGKIAKKLKVDRIAGGETAGIPLATAVSLTTKIPMVYVRKVKREYPRTSVEGIIKKGDKVALLDDSLVSGEHKIVFLKNLKQAGAKVKALIVIVDVPFHSRTKERKKFLAFLKKEKIKFYYLIKWPDWYRIMGKYKCMSPAMAEIGADCAGDMAGWQHNQKNWQKFNQVNKKQKGRFV